jgi:NitT/TauT family transport system permease protein
VTVERAITDTPTLAEVQDRLADERLELQPERTARRRPGWLRPQVWLPSVVALGLLVLGWQLYALHHPYVIPTVPQVVSALVEHPGLYWRNLLVTLQEAVVGAALGMSSAFVLAVLMIHVRMLERALLPLAVLLAVTPIIAIAPGLVVAFGFGFTPKYIITAVIVFFPFLINSLVGLRAVEPQALDVMMTVDASRREVLWRLRLPSSVPFLLAAARVCLPLSVVGAVVAEFSAAGHSGGLGTLIETAASQSDLTTIYASVVMLAVLGLFLTLVAVAMQQWLSRWDMVGNPSARRWSGTA